MWYTTRPRFPFAGTRHCCAKLWYRVSYGGPVSDHSCALLSRLLWIARTSRQPFSWPQSREGAETTDGLNLGTRWVVTCRAGCPKHPSPQRYWHLWMQSIMWPAAFSPCCMQPGHPMQLETSKIIKNNRNPLADTFQTLQEDHMQQQDFQIALTKADPALGRPCLSARIKPGDEMILYVGNDSSCDVNANLHMPLLVTLNNSPTQPRLCPSPLAAGPLRAVGSPTWAAALPKLSTQARSPVWTIMKRVEWFIQGGKLLAQGKETRVPSQTSKPNGEEFKSPSPCPGKPSPCCLQTTQPCMS